MDTNQSIHDPTPDYISVVRQIREMVLSGELKPGERLLSERKLCARLEVSRATLRRALQALAERNIVKSRQGAGTYLIAGLEVFSAEDVLIDAISGHPGRMRSILEFRQLIEPQIAALAAKRMRDKDLASLKSIVVEQEKSLQQGKDTSASDSAFHRLLVQSTGNQVLIRVMDTIASVVDQSRADWLQSNRRANASLTGHSRIIRALEQRKPDHAFNAMTEHIEEIEQIITGRDTSIAPGSSETTGEEDDS